MAAIQYKDAIKLLGDKLDSIVAANDFVEKPVKGMILGGYALHALCENYNVYIPRNTDDIDLYTPDARTLMSDEVKIGPTGARVQLTDDFRAELFEWISGMDNEKDLEKKILDGLESGNLPLARQSEQTIFYLPTPQIFVTNKLFSYRGQTSRRKDLKDVKMLVTVLDSKDKPALAKVKETVQNYGLSKEYELALSQ